MVVSGRGLELDLVAATRAGSAARCRSAMPFGTCSVAWYCKLSACAPCGIEQQLVPVEHGEFAGGGAARMKTLRLGRRDEVERHVERRDAGRHVDVERVHVDVVAFPWDGASAALDLEADEVRRWVRWGRARRESIPGKAGSSDRSSPACVIWT